jgi:hypothetical protein
MRQSEKKTRANYNSYDHSYKRDDNLNENKKKENFLLSAQQTGLTKKKYSKSAKHPVPAQISEHENCYAIAPSLVSFIYVCACHLCDFLAVFHILILS